MVNDASDDDSAKIINEYAEKYSNFIAIHRDENSGSAAEPRNDGLRIASGKYIMFLDPDDEFRPDMCQTLYNKIENTNADLVKCNYISIQDGVEEPKYYYDKSIEELTIREKPPGYVMIWNGIHKADIVKNINFKNVLGEDFVFSLEEFIAIDSMIYMNHYFGYNYYQNPGQSHATKPTVEKFYSTLESFKIASEIVKQNNAYDIVPDLFGTQIQGLYSRIEMLDLNKDEKIQLLKDINNLSKSLEVELEVPYAYWRRVHKLNTKNRYNLAYNLLELHKKVR